MSELEKIESVVSDHAVSIALMTKAVSSIESLLTQQTISIKEIEKAMKSQELLMEKLSNLDNRVNDSITRIHSRINKNESEIDLLKLSMASTCDIVKPMAEKGARVHSGMVVIAKGLAASFGLTILAMFIWLIKAGAAG